MYSIQKILNQKLKLIETKPKSIAKKHHQNDYTSVCLGFLVCLEHMVKLHYVSFNFSNPFGILFPSISARAFGI